MRYEHLKYLTDPITNQPFELSEFERQGQHIISGILKNHQSWYPIINGVPRILIGTLKTTLLINHLSFLHRFQSQLSSEIKTEWEAATQNIDDLDTFLKHQKKTAESFSYEWKHIYHENDYEKQNFLHFLSPFINEEDFKQKNTLDIGCGSGRFTKWAALFDTNISFGTDLGETVEVAFKLTKNIANTCIVQADIYAMPFHRIFDLSYSIGVLHHLPKPETGFAQLPDTIKPSGKMLIWVYNRLHNARAIYFYEPLRSALKHLPKPLLYKICYLPGAAVHAINYITHALNAIGLTTAAKKVPFSYYANFPFNMKLNDSFDVLATPKSNYYYREEIEKWFSEAKLNNISAYEHPEAGITCIGTHGD